ncbi:MAG: sensor histidine kinase [Verrucomicrobiota bacterium]
MRESTEAIKRSRPMLLDRRGSGWGSRTMDALQVAINDLLWDHQERTATQRGYVEQVRATLGSLREAVFMIDADNAVVMANEPLGELVQGTESPVGRRLESLIQGTDFFAYVREVKAGRKPEFSVVEVTMGRRTRWFEITGSQLPEQASPDGRLTLFVLHDITERKRLERVRTEFVANISHELRTPVTIIKGFADMLAEEDTDLSAEERRHYVKKIQGSVQRLNLMLEDLLMLSRLETNPDALQPEMSSLGTIVRETTEDFHLRLEKGQTLQVKIAEGPDELMLDALRISQVVENLLENVLRHAKGFSRIEVRTHRDAEGVTCEVEDDGPGVPAKDLPHLFERFYRVEKGRSRESGGTGLGLSIVKHIVQQHGGEVHAVSQVGQGTTIGFKIPYPEHIAHKAAMSFVRDERVTSRALQEVARRP